jgi:integrase
MDLNDKAVQAFKHSGKLSGDKYTDGGGMYLLVTATGKYWRMNYRYTDKRKTLALGVYPAVSLAKARKRREEARMLLADGIDPGQAKKDGKQDKATAAIHTFEVVARQWLVTTSADRVASTQEKNTAWMERNIFPFIGAMPIAKIKSVDVLAALRKIEARGAVESAHKIKQLCGQVFRFAVSTSLVERDVTADLRGALSTPAKGHFAAITEPKEVGTLLRAIYDYQGTPATVAAMKLSGLLFVRPGELRAMAWSDLNMVTAEWRYHITKTDTPHIVPLSTQSLTILRELHAATGHGRYVFPSLLTGERCMSENTVNTALRRMGITKNQMTAHGFRAMARTIMDEVMEERVDLIEHQLGHAVKDANGNAYNRTAHLPARKAMMQRWADYLDKLRIGAEVIPLRANI